MAGLAVVTPCANDVVVTDGAGCARCQRSLRSQSEVTKQQRGRGIARGPTGDTLTLCEDADRSGSFAGRDDSNIYIMIPD